MALWTFVLVIPTFSVTDWPTCGPTFRPSSTPESWLWNRSRVFVSQEEESDEKWEVFCNKTTREREEKLCLGGFDSEKKRIASWQGEGGKREREERKIMHGFRVCSESEDAAETSKATKIAWKKREREWEMTSALHNSRKKNPKISKSSTFVISKKPHTHITK